MDILSEKEKIKEQLRPFFEPKSIAVIGASHKEGSPGNVIFYNLMMNYRSGKLKARVYGVNIKGGELFGEKLYKTILDIPDDVEHAIIVIPAKFTPSIMKECGEKGVKVATIISGGFSEVGNVELEKQVLEIAREYGIRIIGPNGLGIFDAYSGVDTLFIPEKKETDEGLKINMPRPRAGYITFLSQSGALGDAVLDYMYGENLGISKFISWGNKIDVDESEMLLYLMDDETTRVVMMYLEGLKKGGKKLVEIGREFSKRKPIVVLKGGVTEAGARATMSHTASLAGNYRIYETAFKEMGAIVAKNLLELLDMAKALALQPPAKGRNVGVVTNGGGPGILVSDFAERAGLRVPRLSSQTVEELKKYVSEGVIPSIATFPNPIDLSGSATDESYVVATQLLLEDPNIDIVVVLALHHPPTISKDMPRKMINVIKDYQKPTLVIDVGSAEVSVWVRKKFDDAGIPAYPLPERAIFGAKALVKYGEWLRKQGVLEQYLQEWHPAI
ncbi:MAG: acetate--CoA ligase family protein [Candidatus Njordarchaeales archaeon]